MIRPPAVAGTFYEGSRDRLRQQVAFCFRESPVQEAKERFIGAVVPHAALLYSGHVAASFYAVAELPKRLIILCPNHTGLGHFAALNREGTWQTPFGEARIDTGLADALMKKCELFADDALAHAREHSLEVQLPFLQQLLGNDFTFVPICLGAPRYDYCEQIGHALADVITAQDEPVGMLASSDLNHYEDQKTTLVKDALAIEQVLALNPRELWRVVNELDVSMCGIVPTTTMLIAARALGASRARLMKHATSGDINHDFGHVVGYASIIVS